MITQAHDAIVDLKIQVQELKQKQLKDPFSITPENFSKLLIIENDLSELSKSMQPIFQSVWKIKEIYEYLNQKE